MTSNIRHNNPRAFARTVTVQSWRTPFSENRAEADLHIYVSFDTARIGDDEDISEWPVRFRLSLKRAELHVLKDPSGVIHIPHSSIVRSEPQTIQREHKQETLVKLNAEGCLAAKTTGLDASALIEGSGATAITDSIQEIGEDVGMKVSHQIDDRGYIFSFKPIMSDRLEGTPWSSKTPRMKVRDQKTDRKRGEPPEIKVEVRCAREDLIIEDIQFRDKTFITWDKLTKKKKFMVEQYLRDELCRFGFYCGDLSQPFTELLLADAITVED